MREHFVNGLRPELKRIVLIADPETFNKGLQIARREEINEQLTNSTTPWTKGISTENKPTPVSIIAGEQQRVNERLERLETAIEKLAVSMEKSQPPRPRYRPFISPLKIQLKKDTNLQNSVPPKAGKDTESSNITILWG